MNIRRSVQRCSSTASIFSLVVLLAGAGCGSSGGSSNGSGGSSGTGGSSGGGTGGSSGGGTGGSNGGGTGGTTGGGTGGNGSGGITGTLIMGNGCAGNTCQNPMCKPLGAAMPIGTSPEIGFELQPSYIPMDTIIPTFDDVPDGMSDSTDPTFNVYGPGEYTKTILSFFKTNNIHADFFINTNNWCGDITQDEDCIATLTDLLMTQNPGNHTVHHVHMGMDLPLDMGLPTGCTGAACEDELKGVESLVNALTAGGRPHLTRFRAPFGEPYQAQGPGLAGVQQVVSKYAVEVGWHMDSGDSSCNDALGVPCFTGTQIFNNVVSLIGTAPGQRWGIVLMHGTFPWTKDAVPMLFGPTGYLAMHGFKLATVEDAICWKYGKHSWEIVQQLAGQPRTAN